MKLAIGDVVRDRSNMTLGTVAGVTDQTEMVLVALQVSGGGLRLAEPNDLDIVARRSSPMTTRRSVTALAVFVLGVIASIVAFRSAEDLGAGWLLMFLTGLGSYSAVTAAYRCWVRLTGPRRFRV